MIQYTILANRHFPVHVKFFWATENAERENDRPNCSTWKCSTSKWKTCNQFPL